MTEPDSAGSDPTELRTRAERDGDGWVINGHKWFSSNGSIADFLIVMAVTDPDARPTSARRCSSSTSTRPAWTIVRDVATMEHPAESYGKLGNHAEILYEDVRILGPRRCWARPGRGLPHRPAPPRPRAHPSLHALAGRLAARLRHALRVRAYRASEGGRAGRQADGPELDRRLGGADARRAADDAARGVEDGHPGRVGRAHRDLADQVLRRERPARRGRSRAADPRRAGLLDRHAAGGDVPLRAGRPLLRRPRRGPPPVGRAPDSARLRAAGRRRAHRARADPSRGGRARQVRRPARGGDRPTTECRAPAAGCAVRVLVVALVVQLVLGAGLVVVAVNGFPSSEAATTPGASARPPRRPRCRGPAVDHFDAPRALRRSSARERRRYGAAAGRLAAAAPAGRRCCAAAAQRALRGRAGPPRPAQRRRHPPGSRGRRS